MVDTLTKRILSNPTTSDYVKSVLDSSRWIVNVPRDDPELKIEEGGTKASYRDESVYVGYPRSLQTVRSGILRRKKREAALIHDRTRVARGTR